MLEQLSLQQEYSGILQRAAEGERSAVEDCIDNYGHLIWSMAKKFTTTTEDAELVTREIFLDIWRHAARFEQTDFGGLVLIAIIARRRLMKYSKQSDHSIN